MDVIKTRSGKPSLILDGYRYRFDCQQKKKPVLRWRCVSTRCKGALKTTLTNKFLALTPHDQCKPDPEKREVEKIMAICKKRIIDEIDTPMNVIYRQESEKLCNKGYKLRTKIKDYKGVKSGFWKTRRRALDAAQNPKSSLDIEELPDDSLALEDPASFLSIELSVEGNQSIMDGKHLSRTDQVCAEATSQNVSLYEEISIKPRIWPNQDPPVTKVPGATENSTADVMSASEDSVEEDKKKANAKHNLPTSVNLDSEEEYDKSSLPEKKISKPALTQCEIPVTKTSESLATLFICNHCGLCFSKELDLNKHHSAHSKEKGFICNVCGKSFTQKSYLSKHFSSHSGFESYESDTSSKSFSENHCLVKRDMCYTKHTSSKINNCNVCSKSFNRAAHLTKHMQNVHSKDKKYSCKKSGKSFAYDQSLTVHEPDVEQYRCNECGVGFPNQPDLTIHHLTHSKITCDKSSFAPENDCLQLYFKEGFVCCAKCNMRFLNISDLGVHVRKVH